MSIIEVPPVRFYLFLPLFHFYWLSQFMGNFRKSTRVTCCDYKGGKRAQRIQKLTASQSATLKRVTEQKEGLELEKLDLENEIKSLLEPTPRLRPPQHVLDLASTIRAQTARQKGTIVSFDDSYLVLKVSLILSCLHNANPTRKR